MQIIDGKKISQEIKDEVKEEVAQLKAEGKDIALAVIQVGADPASSVYVRNKKRACEYVGIESVSYELPEETTQEELMAIVDKCNKDPKINGILVQLPLPKHLDEDEVLLAIDPKKDVDGFHPVSVGNMVIGEKGFLPCTPAGVIQLLKRSGVEIDGKECVVVGRSNIVGKPMAMLLLRENGTVTICHSHTKDLKEVCKRADILVVAIGKPKFIDDSYVKDGAVVIDVGIKECRDFQFRQLFLHQAVVLNRLIDARSGKQRVELAVVTQNRPVLADILNHHHLMRLAPVLIGGEIVFYPLLELP